VEGGIGDKNLVFSTVGDRRVFERLPQSTVKPALALSLHTTDAELRRSLLPRAPDIAPAELVELGEAYVRRTGYPLQYPLTLLERINDSDAEVDWIARLLAGKYAVMNLIPYNSVESFDFRRPSWERAAEMTRSLHRRGVLTKLRRSAGQDVEGGCGQWVLENAGGRSCDDTGWTPWLQGFGNQCSRQTTAFPLTPRLHSHLQGSRAGFSSIRRPCSTWFP
jgi:23S rRNA (adenine2503-C2)-methyltransferase